jgi:glycosyltransferase involved in cell wall biosynthesis
VPDEKLFFCPCAVDNAFWREQAKKLKGAKESLKYKMNIPSESPVILFVGKFIPRKRPLDLLQAFEGLPSSKLQAWLVFVGDGSLKPALTGYVQEHNLRRVAFAGFKNQSELAPFYAMADVFVLPSEHDPSPKALNEAMNFSLPVVTTDRLGTAPDLVRHGENGFVYPMGNVSALQGFLSEILESPEVCEEMGECSLEIVSEWSFENDIKGVVAALDYIRHRRGRV